jgi:hypothetical protein
MRTQRKERLLWGIWRCGGVGRGILEMAGKFFFGLISAANMITFLIIQQTSVEQNPSGEWAESKLTL